MKFKPAWTKEPKAMGLCASRKPQTGYHLSGVVVVQTEDEIPATAYIRFSPEAEEMLGQKMPYGVGPADPAFLKVVWNGWTHEVRGCYIGDEREVLLWNTRQVPEWCVPKPIRSHHGKQQRTDISGNNISRDVGSHQRENRAM
jgi:hypothetical protein